MDITGIAKSHQAGIPKASSKREWKLSDSLREQIAGYSREDAAQGVYMGNKFLSLCKSEVAKVAPDRGLQKNPFSVGGGKRMPHGVNGVKNSALQGTKDSAPNHNFEYWQQ